MGLSIFENKTVQPTPEAIAEALGTTATLWDQVIAKISADLEPIDLEWKCYKGWVLILKRHKRNLVHLFPNQGYFIARTALNDKAVDQLPAAGLPEELVDSIITSKRYQEGRLAHFEVRTAKDIEIVRTLAGLKANS